MIMRKGFKTVLEMSDHEVSLKIEEVPERNRLLLSLTHFLDSGAREVRYFSLSPDQWYAIQHFQGDLVSGEPLKETT